MIRAGQGLLLIAAALLCLGVVMVTSAGLSVGDTIVPSFSEIVTGRTVVLAVVAVAVMVMTSRLPLKWLGAAPGGVPLPVVAIIAALIMVLLVYVPGLGHEVNGARRWLRAGPVGFQPSELLKWASVFFIAFWVSRPAYDPTKFLRGFLVPIGIVALGCAAIAMEDLGTAMLIGVVALGVLYCAGCRLWHILAIAPIGGAAMIGAIMAMPYRIARLQAFLDPFEHPQTIGYHIIQSMSSVSGGGLVGRGLGNSIQKFGYLPEDTTDFVFAIVCEELGVAGAVLVIGLYVALLLTGVAILRQSANRFHQAITLGVILTIGLQASINMLVVTGMAPTKGIALPLLSAGGTGWLLTACVLGVLWAIDRHMPGGESQAPCPPIPPSQIVTP